MEALEPLFTAVAHGCLAGLHQQALDEVYWPRIQRKGDYYLHRKLGAFGSDLACIACFFEKTWDKPAAELHDEAKARALSLAGFGLHCLNRLYEAVDPFLACVDMRKQQQDWKNAAGNASNTGELYLALGNLTQATELSPHHSVLFVYLAVAHWRLGNRQEARKAALRARELGVLETSIVSLQLAEVLVALGEG